MHGLHKLGKPAMGVGLGVGLVVLGWLAGQWAPASFAQTPQGKGGTPAQALPDYDRNVVAYVNGRPITRLELAEDLIARKGKQHLELLINRRIIEQACAQAGITVTDAEVDKELHDEMSARSLLEPGMFEKLLRQQGLTLMEYKEDGVRKTLMMEKLARSRVNVTEEEVQKAFQVNFGERVLCKVILVLGHNNKKEADRIYFEVKDSENAFITHAKKQAIPHLAANAGETVVGHFNSVEHVAKEAFRLEDGEVSHILQVPEGWLIMRREKLVPADTATKFEDVRAQLEKRVFDKKMDAEVKGLFGELRKKAVVRDYLNNDFGLNDVMTESFKESERKLQSGAVKPTPRGPASASGAKK